MQKSALITGASGGIGLELSKIFAKNRNNVVLVARNENKLLDIKKEIESEYGVKAYVYACDLGEKDAALKVFDFCREQHLSIDYLVNNAGFGDCAPFAESDWQKQYDMIRLNIVALSHLTHCFLPEMIERRAGRILNIASVASLCAGPNMSVYYASKAYVRSFSEAISVEARKHGVSVTAICPGPVDTGFERAANVGNAPAFNILPLADSKKVALFAYRAMMKGKTVKYYGFTAKAMAFAVRLLPECASRKIAGRLNAKKEDKNEK